MTAAVPADVTHDSVTAAMLRHRRLLATAVMLGFAIVSVFVVVALLRARAQPWLGLVTTRTGVSIVEPTERRGDVTVRFVRPGGAAERAGLRAGDRILRIDDIEAGDVDRLAALHDRLSPGDTLTYDIERADQRLTVQVVTGAVMREPRQWIGVGTRVFVVLALFIGIPATVYRWRPNDPRALLFMLFACTFGLSMLTFAVPEASHAPQTVLPMPDAYIRMNAAALAITFIGALVVSPTLLHFLALFPQPRLAPVPLARALRWTYLLPLSIAGVGAPVAVLLAARVLPSHVRHAAALTAAGVALLVAARLYWLRLRSQPWRTRVLDRPGATVAVTVLTYSAVALVAFVIVHTRSRPLAGMMAALLIVASVIVFSLCIGVLYPVASGIAMWRSWRLSSEEQRRQIRWPLVSIAWALGIALVLSVISMVLSLSAASTPPPWLYSTFEASTWIAYSVIPIAFAAAVLRYGLMDIRVIIRLTFFYLLATASVYVGAFATALLLATAAGEATASTRVTTVAIALVVVSLVEPLRRRVQRHVDKRFYQRTPDPVGVLARHGEALRTMPHRDDLERRLVLALQEAIPHTPTYVFRRRDGASGFVAAHSPDPKARESFEALPFLAARAPDLHGPTALTELSLPPEEARTWEHLGIEVLLPVRHGEAIPVVLGIGRKRSDEAWQERDIEVLSSLAAQTSMAIGDIEARLHESSLREAFDNQRALLPQQLPQPDTFSVAGAWHPALTVGGDYYDAWWLSHDAIAVCVADVAGKGLAASLVMANLQATVKALSGPDVSPADLCTRVNDTLATNLRRGRFVTFFYAVLHLSSGELHYANAGHNPPLLFSGGRTQELGLGDPGLGLLRTHRYGDRLVRLDQDARLLLFTDGVTEGRSPDGEDFGMKRLGEIVARRHATAGALRDDVLSAIAAWTQGRFDDDVTLLAIVRRQGLPDDVFQSQNIRLPVTGRS